MGFRPSSRTSHDEQSRLTANVLIYRNETYSSPEEVQAKLFLSGRHYDQKFRIQYFFAYGFLGIKCHIFEVLSSSSSQ